MFGKTEDLVVVLVIVLVLFGAKKLPELSKGIAESVREVRKGFKDDPPAQAPGESQPPRRVS
jgi:sec-independent protein translocase protein TatA